MALEWSKKWISSISRRKQRKYRANAPLHIKNKFLSVQLSKNLKKEYNRRNIRVVTGDIVKVTTGDMKGKTGTVTKIDVKRSKVYVDKIVRKKADGSEVNIALEPSNLMIIELNTKDPKRIKKE